MTDARLPGDELEMRQFRPLADFVFELRREDVVLPFAGEGEVAGQHLEREDAERVDVGARVDRLSHYLLGRHVADGADGHLVLESVRARARELREAEIEHLHVVAVRFLVHEDVFALEVEVDYHGAMRRGDRVANLEEYRERPLRRKGPSVRR